MTLPRIMVRARASFDADASGWRPGLTVILIYLSAVPMVATCAAFDPFAGVGAFAATAAATLGAGMAFCAAATLAARFAGFGDLFGLAGLMSRTAADVQHAPCRDAKPGDDQDCPDSHSVDRAPSCGGGADEVGKDENAPQYQGRSERSPPHLRDVGARPHPFDLPLTNRELAAFLARREGGEGRR